MEIEELALASREPSGKSRRDASAQLKDKIRTVIDMEKAWGSDGSDHSAVCGKDAECAAGGGGESDEGDPG